MNDLEAIHQTLLAFPKTTEETPFGPQVLVYKVAGKMFATFSPDDFPVQMNLKCQPERAVELRDEHPAVLPGYHMNKRHWNTLILDGTLPDQMVMELIKHSFDCVVQNLPLAVRKQLQKDS